MSIWPSIGEATARAPVVFVSQQRNRGGRRLFVPHQMTAADLEAMGALNQAIAKRRQAQDNVRLSYYEWCLLNRQEQWGQASLVSFVAALTLCLSASTVDTYTTHLAAVERERFRRPAELVISELRRLTKLARAANRGKHAKDFISTVSAVTYALRLPKGRVRLAAFAMMAFGPRLADLQKWCGANVKIGPDAARRSAAFDICVSKGIRRAISKRRVQLQAAHLEFLPADIYLELAELFDGDSEECPLEDVRIPNLLGYTSNSYRRNFIHRRLEEHTDENGVCDYDAVAKYTGHLSAGTLQAFYLPDLSRLMQEDAEA